MDSQLNNKSLLTLLQMLGSIAAEINPGVRHASLRAIWHISKSPTTTGVNTHHSSHSTWELYVSLGKMT